MLSNVNHAKKTLQYALGLPTLFILKHVRNQREAKTLLKVRYLARQLDSLTTHFSTAVDQMKSIRNIFSLIITSHDSKIEALQSIALQASWTNSKNINELNSRMSSCLQEMYSCKCAIKQFSENNREMSEEYFIEGKTELSKNKDLLADLEDEMVARMTALLEGDEGAYSTLVLLPLQQRFIASSDDIEPHEKGPTENDVLSSKRSRESEEDSSEIFRNLRADKKSKLMKSPTIPSGNINSNENHTISSGTLMSPGMESIFKYTAIPSPALELECKASELKSSQNSISFPSSSSSEDIILNCVRRGK